MLKKTAIIVGASGGIGCACAQKFAREGYNLALTYFSTPIDFAESLEINFDIKVKTYHLDVTAPAQIDKFCKSVFQDFEYIDAAVLCPGVSERGMLIDQSSEQIERIISVNLLGMSLLARSLSAKFFEGKHGSIVLISSVHGLNGSSCEAAYSASKAGLIALGQALSKELAPHVRVNSIAPGFIKTKMTASFTKKEREALIDKIPLARLGESSDIAEAAFFLASDSSSYITGITLPVSGGVVAF